MEYDSLSLSFYVTFSLLLSDSIFFITLHILGAIEEEIDYACLGSELTIYKEFLKLDQGPHEVH